MQRNRHIEAILHTLPDKPGVYIMKDEQGEVIYVGKAISLKNRVRQYFRSHRSHSSKVIAMVQRITEIQYIIVDSEMEALILECNLIKEHRPHYNILMKDDKNYPYVRVNLKEPFPKVEVVRKVNHDGAKYFGPYLAAGNLADVMDALAKNFPLANCKRDIVKSREKGERPCLNYQIGRCSGPCANRITQEAYGEIIASVVSFLQGDYGQLADSLKERMQKASLRQDYEQAAAWRDRLRAVERVMLRQKAAYASLDERDILGLARLDADAMVHLFQMRDGKILGAEQVLLEDLDPQESDADILTAFIKDYYGRAPHVPREILVQAALPEDELLSQWLSGLRKSGKAHLLRPQRGDKRKTMELSIANAAEALQKRQLRAAHEYERNEGALEQLAEILGLPQSLHRLECFDISHTQGVDNVASMVVSVDGRAVRKEYRRFRIKTVEGADDFASMAEVIHRRLSRAMEPDEDSQRSFGQLPELMVIDGGRGQLNAALKAMESLGFSIPAIGLAERIDEIFVPDGEGTIVLDRKDPALHVLQRLRDEAHRFAVTYHRSLRASRQLTGELDALEGIGKARKKSLLTHFKTMEQMKQATAEELAALPGMNRSAAQRVFSHFQTPENDGQEGEDVDIIINN